MIVSLFVLQGALLATMYRVQLNINYVLNFLCPPCQGGTHDHNFSINAIQGRKMQQRKVKCRNKIRLHFLCNQIPFQSYLIIMIMFCLFWLQHSVTTIDVLFSAIVPKDHRELRREEEEERNGRSQTSISVLPTPYLAYQTYLGPMSRLSVGILYPQKERLPRISMATSVSRSAETNTAELYFHCLFFSPDRV